MNQLYDSEAFVVVHETVDLAQSQACGVEGFFVVVNKQQGRQVTLAGPWAKIFVKQLDAWQRDTPSSDEVEAILDSYCALAHTPMMIH